MFVSGSKKQLEIQTESIKSLRIEKRKLTEKLQKYEAIEGAMSELDNSQYLNIWTGEIVSANGIKYEVTIEKNGRITMDEQIVKVEMPNKELNRMIAIVDIVDEHFKNGEIKDVSEMVNELEEVGE